MQVFRVTQSDDPRLADYRSVSDAELLRDRNLFVVEGRLGVGRLLASRHRVVSLLLNDASFLALEASLTSIRDQLPVYIIGTADFRSITGFNLHRGCLALARRPEDSRPSDIVGSTDLIVVLEDVADASNVGAVFRNASAFGAGAILLSPACCDPLYRKSIRTSMGGVLTVPYARVPNWPSGLTSLKSAGFTVVALTPAECATDLRSFASQRQHARLALMIGSEANGLTPDAEAIADVRVRIPIRADVDSLNLATAAGIALYALRA